MAENCPCNFDVCDNICGLYNEEKDTCGYFFPPMPLSEILTPPERLGRLERKQPEEKPVSNSDMGDCVLGNEIYDDLNGLKDSVKRLWDEVNTHIDTTKKRKPIKYIIK